MKSAKKQVYYGNFVFAPSLAAIHVLKKTYITVIDGVITKIDHQLTEDEKALPLQDFKDHLVIPGFVDLHFHASQFNNRGLGLDEELLPWLEIYTFPEEAKFADPSYAKEVYQRAIQSLAVNGTTRTVVFATIHLESTKILFDLFKESGLGAYIGKVNMDRNAPSYLIEDAEQSIKDTVSFISGSYQAEDLVKPIITPRFVPTCSEELMKSLGKIALEKSLAIQSHISENQKEVQWVKELHPEFTTYGEVYDSCGLMGATPTIMAHCVYNSMEDIRLMAEKQIFAAHCPQANFNLSSGIMPVRKYIDMGVPIGLGTDVGAGHVVSIPKVMVSAIQSSKLLWLKNPKDSPPLNLAEVFYFGTKGGGSFFGKVGSFEKGYDFDALVIDDFELGPVKDLSFEERLQRFIYIGDDRQIKERYVKGKKLLV